MIILDGKKKSSEIASSLREAISQLDKKPKLLIILVGDDIASQVYVNRKEKFADDVGVEINIKKLNSNVDENEVISLINEANEDQSVNGIMVQLPLPEGLNRKKILNSIKPEKDVDGLVEGNDKFISATTRGTITLLEEYNINLSGKKVVIINDTDLIGKPLSRKMSQMGAETVICNEETKDIKQITKTADILVTAIGKPEIIDESYLSDGQVVIDIGISKTENGVVGDVKKNVETELEALTPVPGGIGPMTVASLFQNVLDVYKMQQN